MKRALEHISSILSYLFDPNYLHYCFISLFAAAGWHLHILPGPLDARLLGRALDPALQRVLAQVQLKETSKNATPKG